MAKKQMYDENGNPVAQKGMGKKILIGVLALLVVGAIGSQMSKPKKVDPTPQNSASIATVASTESSASAQKESSEAPSKDDVFNVGDTVEYKGIKVTLKEVKEAKGSEFLKPDDGNVYVLPVFEIDNGSDKELNVSSMMSFEAYQDGYATSISIGAISAAKDLKQLDGTVAPGKKMLGIVGYEVPAEYKELEIHYNPTFFGEKVVYKYTK